MLFKITPKTASQEKVESEDKSTEARVSNNEAESGDKKTTAVVLTNVEEKMYDKILAKIQENYDLLEKQSEFDEFYKKHMKDQELGAYDIIFCPEKLQFSLYRFASLVKTIELMLVLYTIIATRVGVSRMIEKVVGCEVYYLNEASAEECKANNARGDVAITIYQMAHHRPTSTHFYSTDTQIVESNETHVYIGYYYDCLDKYCKECLECRPPGSAYFLSEFDGKPSSLEYYNNVLCRPFQKYNKTHYNVHKETCIQVNYEDLYISDLVEKSKCNTTIVTEDYIENYWCSPHSFNKCKSVMKSTFTKEKKGWLKLEDAPECLTLSNTTIASEGRGDSSDSFENFLSVMLVVFFTCFISYQLFAYSYHVNLILCGSNFWYRFEAMEQSVLTVCTVMLLSEYVLEPPDIELIFNGVALTFIAEIDEKLISWYIKDEQHRKICKEYFEYSKERNPGKEINTNPKFTLCQLLSNVILVMILLFGVAMLQRLRFSVFGLSFIESLLVLFCLSFLCSFVILILIAKK